MRYPSALPVLTGSFFRFAQRPDYLRNQAFMADSTCTSSSSVMM